MAEGKDEESVVEDIAKAIGAIQPRYSENAPEIEKLLIKKDSSISEASKKVKSQPVWSHKLIYDAFAEQLEPVYFWILDFIQDMDYKVDKIVDNFSASPGSGYFAEMGARATRMQEEGMKIMGNVNLIIKSVINLLYDLKEFEIRLSQYDLAKSKNSKEQEAGILGLKQIWMDKVDIQKGRGSINSMSYELMFTTLRDAFMAAKEIKDVDRMDLNDRVKRILKPRLAEFFAWKEQSERELRKRFEIETSYLKSQVGSLKLYTRWAKPYLKAAEQLMMAEKGREPALVKAFNMILLELCLLCKSKIDVKKAVDARMLPKSFREIKVRDYFACVLLDFTFRGSPRKVGGGAESHYAFGGRVDVNFKAFALNSDELKLLDEQLKKSDFNDALKLVESITGESLKSISDDITHFTENKKEEKKPAFGLFAAPKKEKKAEGGEEEKKKEIKIKKDSFEESVIRSVAEQSAAAGCFAVYDKYKKAHGMASFAEPDWGYPAEWRPGQAKRAVGEDLSLK
jgi:hypothetical protein